jgi:hypothetical protein
MIVEKRVKWLNYIEKDVDVRNPRGLVDIGILIQGVYGSFQ